MRQVVLFLALTLALAGGVATYSTGPAGASEWWCWDDPVLVIDNQVLHILAGVPEHARQRVTLADLTVSVPEGADAKITASNSARFPVRSRLVRSGSGTNGTNLITVTLVVRGQGRFDTALKLSQPSGGEAVAYGQSEQPITLSFAMPAKSSANRARR